MARSGSGSRMRSPPQSGLVTAPRLHFVQVVVCPNGDVTTPLPLHSGQSTNPVFGLQVEQVASAHHWRNVFWSIGNGVLPKTFSALGFRAAAIASVIRPAR